MTAAAQGEAVPAAAGAEPAPLSAANHAGWALGSFATSVLINSTGLLAMRPILSLDSRDVWQLSMMQEAGRAKAS